VIERVYVIRVEAFDWNCPQHITPRFTADQIQEVLSPFEKRMQQLEQENKKLRESHRSSKNKSEIEPPNDLEGANNEGSRK
jgi:hypothetical protein